MRMSSITATSVLGIVFSLGVAVPSPAHAQNIPQMLQGLTTGNQNEDRKLQDAYERGYQKGRQDEARLNRRPSRDNRRREDDRRNDNSPQQYDQGSGSYRR